MAAHDQLSKRGGDAPRGGDCGSDRDSGTPSTLLKQPGTLVEDPVTGRKIIVVPPKTPRHFITLKRPVVGLMAFTDSTGLMLCFQLTRIAPIVEDEARGAQAEAGWHPAGFGFYGFRCDPTTDGMYLASWSCGRGGLD